LVVVAVTLILTVSLAALVAAAVLELVNIQAVLEPLGKATQEAQVLTTGETHAAEAVVAVQAAQAEIILVVTKVGLAALELTGNRWDRITLAVEVALQMTKQA
jgi:hypothetical protein